MRVKKHLVICGWNSKAKYIIDEIQKKTSKKIGRIGLIAAIKDKPIDNWTIFFINGDPTKESDLKRANIEKADKILILADESKGTLTKDRDAHSLLIAQKIRKMHPPVYICMELMDKENQYFAELVKVNDIIFTNEINGQIFSQTIQNNGILNLYNELLNNSYGKSIEKILPPHSVLGMNFDQALIALRKKSKIILLGMESKGQLILNPSDNYFISEYDHLFVLSQKRNL